MPALPLHEAGKYVAAAYIVFLGLVLVYVAIMAARLSRVERELGELLALAQDRGEDLRRPGAPPGQADHELIGDGAATGAGFASGGPE
jgi:hypothetical protein